MCMYRLSVLLHEISFAKNKMSWMHDNFCMKFEKILSCKPTKTSCMLFIAMNVRHWTGL